jgi:ferrous iron transport protein B
MWDRSRLFLRKAGTVILGINILLWFLVTFPRDAAATASFDARRAGVVRAAGLVPADAPAEAVARAVEGIRSSDGAGAAAVRDEIARLDREESGDALRHSMAGRLGQWIEPVLRPLGFDWKMGIGIVASFAAREVFVSTMSVVYNAGETDAGDQGAVLGLAERMQRERWPDGTPVYTTTLGLTLMVFYVFAMQCVSTVAVVRRETNGWRWPIFQVAYMTTLAWLMALATRWLATWMIG